MTAETSLKCAKELYESMKCYDKVFDKVWIVSASFCAIGYIKISGYLPVDSTLDFEQ